MDYKYIIHDKTKYEYKLDYLNIYYEDDDYIVYENQYYNPFYVYESYYSSKDVVNLNETDDYIEFQKNLFKGVILDDNDYKLNKLEFNYDDSTTKSIEGKSEISFEYVGEGKFVGLDVLSNVGYEGNLYIEQFEGINSIEFIDNGNVKKCEFDGNMYKCNFSKSVDKVIVESSNNIEKLNYYVSIKDDKDKNYLLINFNGIDEEYLTYYFDTKTIILLDGKGNQKKCYDGFCKMGEFKAKYIVVDFDVESIFRDSEEFILKYQEFDSDYYYDNVKDLYASNKKLTYKKSAINVKYDRISNSDNDQIIVLPITYSEEWRCYDENYEIIKANGGYLGIKVANDIKNIDVTLSFKPSGIKIGLIGSVSGFIIYGAYIFVYCYIRKRGNKKDVQE
jgi:uncharacterized membrane protein YfhO